eukprot:TRINITY_DN16529_c0_g1_i1.p1 TRINITY_DN16529_c0_g1~~TRINITY_DN16529_c0_g1_i1.p1  ORF type:complete len:527 (-),score=83.38 TRINITY_DN16529_c0_g1_i1:197-1777(-)
MAAVPQRFLTSRRVRRCSGIFVVGVAFAACWELSTYSVGFLQAQGGANSAQQGLQTSWIASPKQSTAPGLADLTSTTLRPAFVAATSAALACTVGAKLRTYRSSGLPGIFAEPPAAADAPAKPKKVRITAFDSIRFFLIAYIVSGHFISFAAPSQFAFKAITQINVVVGAFFALSGYVAAYTTTENAERAASPKLLSTPTPKWILQRVFGYYPLHLLVLLIFSPMFIYSDLFYSGWQTALGHGLMAVTMTQAWFPMHAEIWNAPTWFLSALTFATALLPFSLPILAKQNKAGLRRTAGFLFLIGLLPKLGYCYDHNAWGLLEGAMAPKAMANLAAFNAQRFNPFYAVIEVLLGAVACRLVMLDGAEGEEKAPSTSIMNTGLPLIGMAGIIILRALGVVQLSDLLTRAVIFIPLFLSFLMGAHRASVVGKVTDPIVNLLSSKPLVTLGNLAFPIFVVHGPLGQLFYKKLIATKIFGGTLNSIVGPQFFYAYLAIVLVCAWILQKTFLTNKQVGGAANNAVNKLSEKL